MTTMTQIATDFNAAFNTMQDVEFNPAWANGTGYFNGAATDTTITTAVRSTGPDGRKLILVPIRGAELNLVFFERYTDNKDIIILHHPRFNIGRKSGKAMMSPDVHPATAEECAAFLNILFGIKYRTEEAVAA